MPKTWKTVIVILVLATAAPAAVILAQNLSIGGGGPEDTLPPGGAVETPERETLICRGAEEFRISNTSTEVSSECCLAAVIGEITNTCNRPLLAAVSAALRSVGGRIVAVSNEDTIIGPLGPRQSTFFRVDLSGATGWEAAQRRNVVREVRANVAEFP